MKPFEYIKQTFSGEIVFGFLRRLALTVKRFSAQPFKVKRGTMLAVKCVVAWKVLP